MVTGIQNHVSETVSRVSEYVATFQRKWPNTFLGSAIRTLFDVGAIDMAASLAYFTFLALLPLAALVVLLFAAIVDPNTVRERISEILLYYFPASQELLDAAIGNVFEVRLAAGFIAIAGMMWGANGLFMAANRAINRVFNCSPRRMLSNMLLHVALALAVSFLFLISISLTVVFQVILNVSQALPLLNASVGSVLVFGLGILLAVIPFVTTTLAFSIAYRALPNRPVKWRDAAFGAVVAVILFEATKHLFFWLTRLATQQNLLYGSLSSAIILLIWANVAALIFLFGASLTKQSTALHTLRFSD